MGKDIVKYGTDDQLAKYGQEPPKVEWNDKQLALIRKSCAPNASDDEFELYMEIAKRTGLNPITREIYCVQYDKKSAAQIFVGKDGYVKRASSFPDYDGFESGYFDDEGVEYKMPLPGKDIIGAWCRVFRKDRGRPVESYVLLSEYKKPHANWKTMQFHMIKKCAESQAHRTAFLANFSNTYGEAEKWMKDAKVVDTISMEEDDSKGIVVNRDEKSVDNGVKAEEMSDQAAKESVQTATKPQENGKFANSKQVAKFWERINKELLMDFMPDEMKGEIDPGLVTLPRMEEIYEHAKSEAAKALA